MFFIKVLSETGCVTIVFEGYFLFDISCSEGSVGLSDIRFITIRAG